MILIIIVLIVLPLSAIVREMLGVCHIRTYRSGNVKGIALYRKGKHFPTEVLRAFYKQGQTLDYRPSSGRWPKEGYDCRKLGS